MKRAAALRQELSAAIRVPYRAHVSRQVVRTESGDYVQVFKLAGASFESADDEVLNNWHERLNVLWRNIASANVALWVHLVRRREPTLPVERVTSGFADRLLAKYFAKLATQTLMVNNLYLSVVYRPVAGAAPNAVARLLSSRRSGPGAASIADARDACDKLSQTLSSSLARYEPEPLGVYRRGARHYSELLELFGVLVNAEWQAMPLPRAPLNEALATTRP